LLLSLSKYELNDRENKKREDFKASPFL